MSFENPAPPFTRRRSEHAVMPARPTDVVNKIRDRSHSQSHFDNEFSTLMNDLPTPASQAFPTGHSVVDGDQRAVPDSERKVYPVLQTARAAPPPPEDEHKGQQRSGEPSPSVAQTVPGIPSDKPSTPAISTAPGPPVTSQSRNVNKPTTPSAEASTSKDARLPLLPKLSMLDKVLNRQTMTAQDSPPSQANGKVAAVASATTSETPARPTTPTRPGTPSKQESRAPSEQQSDSGSTKPRRRRSLSLSALFTRKKKNSLDDAPPIPDLPVNLMPRKTGQPGVNGVPSMPELPAGLSSKFSSQRKTGTTDAVVAPSRPETPTSATPKATKRKTLLGKTSLKDLFSSSNSADGGVSSSKSVRRSKSKPELKKNRLDDAPPVPSLPPVLPQLRSESPVSKPTLVPDALAALTGSRSGTSASEAKPDVKPTEPVRSAESKRVAPPKVIEKDLPAVTTTPSKQVHKPAQPFSIEKPMRPMQVDPPLEQPDNEAAKTPTVVPDALAALTARSRNPSSPEKSPVELVPDVFAAFGSTEQTSPAANGYVGNTIPDKIRAVSPTPALGGKLKTKKSKVTLKLKKDKEDKVEATTEEKASHRRTRTLSQRLSISSFAPFKKWRAEEDVPAVPAMPPSFDKVEASRSASDARASVMPPVEIVQPMLTSSNKDKHEALVQPRSATPVRSTSMRPDVPSVIEGSGATKPLNIQKRVPVPTVKTEPPTPDKPLPMPRATIVNDELPATVPFSSLSVDESPDRDELPSTVAFSPKTPSKEKVTTPGPTPPSKPSTPPALVSIKLPAPPPFAPVDVPHTPFTPQTPAPQAAAQAKAQAAMAEAPSSTVRKMADLQQRRTMPVPSSHERPARKTNSVVDTAPGLAYLEGDASSDEGDTTQSHASTIMPSFSHMATAPSPSATLRSSSAPQALSPDVGEPPSPAPSATDAEAAVVQTAQTARRSIIRSVTTPMSSVVSLLQTANPDDSPRSSTIGSTISPAVAAVFGVGAGVAAVGSFVETDGNSEETVTPEMAAAAVGHANMADEASEDLWSSSGESSPRSRVASPVPQPLGLPTLEDISIDDEVSPAPNPFPATTQASSDDYNHHRPTLLRQLSTPASAPASLSRASSPFGGRMFSPVGESFVGATLLTTVASAASSMATAVTSALSPQATTFELPDQFEDNVRDRVFQSPSVASDASFESAEEGSVDSATFESYDLAPSGRTPPIAPYMPSAPPPIAFDDLPPALSMPRRRGSVPAVLAATAARRRTSSVPVGNRPSMADYDEDEDDDDEELPLPRRASVFRTGSPVSGSSSPGPYQGRNVSCPLPTTRGVSVATDSRPGSPLDLHMPGGLTPKASESPTFSSTPVTVHRTPTATDGEYTTVAGARTHIRRDSGITSAVGAIGFARQGPIDSDAAGVAVNQSRAAAAVQYQAVAVVRHSLPFEVDYRSSRASFRQSAHELSHWNESTASIARITEGPETSEPEEESFQLDSGSSHSSSGSDDGEGAPSTPRTPDLNQLAHVTPPAHPSPSPIPASYGGATGADEAQVKGSVIRLARAPFRAMHHDMSQDAEGDDDGFSDTFPESLGGDSFTTAHEVGA